MGSKDRGERRAGSRVAGMAVGLSVLAILFFGLGDMTTVRGSSTGQVTKGAAGFVGMESLQSEARARPHRSDSRRRGSLPRLQ